MVAHQPDETKYMFEVQHVNNQSDYMSIKSKKTGKFLASDEDGKAFMKEVNPSSMKDDQPTDRQTWFLLHFVEAIFHQQLSFPACVFSSATNKRLKLQESRPKAPQKK